MPERQIDRTDSIHSQYTQIRSEVACFITLLMPVLTKYTLLGNCRDVCIIILYKIKAFFAFYKFSLSRCNFSHVELSFSCKSKQCHS